MAFFRAWFGVRVVLASGALVSGERRVPLENHVAICERSYVWPSHVETGSTITLWPMGQR